MSSSFFKTYLKQIVLVVTPLVFAPLLFLDELSVLDQADLCDIYQINEESCDATIARLTNDDQPCLFKCAYVVAIMVIYWCAECAPLPATALIPLFAYPFTGVLPGKKVCGLYFKDVIVLFLGGLTLAIAIELWNLHKRIALFVLSKVGARPMYLLAGFMGTTSFISMWMSNVATTAMMTPIAQAVLEQLKSVALESKEDEVEKRDDNRNDKTPESDHQLLESGLDKGLKSDELAIKTRMYNGLCKALMLGIAYCASIGGTGMLLGTGPNLIVVNQAMDKYDESVTFVKWAMFATPTCIIMTVICWGVLVYMFLMDPDRHKVDNEKETELASANIKREYESLGMITFPEKMIIGHFVTLLVLWLTRAPGGKGTGWSVYFKPGYVTDGSSALFICFLLFILPAEMPFRQDEDKNYIVSKPLMTWKQMITKMGWGVIFLLGGGFAMAGGITSSGLGKFVGIKMSGLSGVSQPLVLLMCVLVINIMTQVTSNSSTMTIFAALLCDMAERLQINPMYLMIPCATSVSMAFCLPVSTPPNAVVEQYGYFRTAEMVKVGAPLSLIGALVSMAMIHVTGGFSWTFDVFNTCPDYLDASAPCKQAAAVNFNLTAT